MMRAIEARLPSLGSVVLLNGSRVLPTESEHADYLDFDQAVAARSDGAHGPDSVYDRLAPGEKDIASLIYTSGTMGRPKGAMLTHGNFAANVESCRQAAPMYAKDNFLLVLPLHHALSFTANLLCPVAVGAQISFVENLKTVSENMREVSPTVLVGVPLLLEKMYARIDAAIRASRIGHALVKLGLGRAIRKRIIDRLGGRLRMVITGGAPCPPEILIGLSRLGILVLEGYGLTETAPVLTLNPPAAPRPGTVGKPLPGIEITIFDPDSEGSGEIAARGPSIMEGYFAAPETTSKVFRDGWFLTGDIGHIDKDGYLTISGRKKSLIVNREGKNIYPEEIEAVLVESNFIQEALALGYGDARDTGGERVGVIVVPNPDAVDEYAHDSGKELTDEEATALIRDEVKRVSQALADYKRPRHIRIRTEEFLKTSTGKIKRHLYSLGRLT
jgi:long-chain acyl-CoA synthetase